MRSVLLLVAFLLHLSFAAYTHVCITDPSLQGCVHYTIPEDVIQEDIVSVCSMGSMGNMSGCTLYRMCKGNVFSGEYCSSFSILKDICQDMAMKPGCDHYLAMCASNSVVQQCQSKTLPIPSSTDLARSISQMCSTMSMEGCSQCAGGGMVPCEVLSVYSSLCLSMSGMEQCEAHDSFCEEVPDWSICSGSGNSGMVAPPMRPYFHTDVLDYVLFRSWVPRNRGEFAGSCIAVFFIALLFEFFRLGIFILEHHWNLTEPEEPPCHEEEAEDVKNPLATKLKRYPFRATVDLPRGLLRFVETGWSLMIMLVVMTFNVGLFLSVCAGAGVGTILFGRFQVGQSKPHH